MVRDSVVVVADVQSSLCSPHPPPPTPLSTTTATDASTPVVALHDLLEYADLLSYYDSLKNVLKLRHASDLCYTDQEDLDGIGMSRPEQKRLFREYAKHFPMATTGKKGFVGKIKRKVFGKGGVGGEGSHLASKSVVTKLPYRVEESSRTKVPSNIARFGMDEFRMDSAAAEGQQQPQQHIIPAERISICKQIGSGEFGCVFQAAWHKDTAGAVTGGGEVIQVAVKQILPEKLISQPSSFLQEAAIMTRMQHENVVRLFGVVLDTKVVMLVSELAPCGSLLECLQSPAWREPFSVPILCQFALQIARGMHYLSTQRLIHRDLAARNVLVSSPSKVKISDFGLSRSLGYGEDYYRSEFTPTMKLPIAWCAPECINFLRFTCASDVWAFGVCLWEMFSYGRTPWAGFTGSQILHAIDTQRNKLERPEVCPSGIYSLMLCCWEWEPEKRPSFEQICKKLPDAFPPELLTVAECRTKRDGQLQFGKGEIIVLLDKSTTQLGQWRGLISKTGKIGFFHPDDTIAHLGAENPSDQSEDLISAVAKTIRQQPIMMSGKTAERGGELGENAAEMKGKKNGKKDKGNKRKEKNNCKLVISQPEHLRHTCHVGADGRSFGLLNIDKNDLPHALPPRMPCSPSNVSPVPDMLSSIMSASTISLAPPRPPKVHTAGTDPMSRSVCLDNRSAEQFVLSSLSSNTTPPQLPYPPHQQQQQQQPPVLPPKPPRFCARPSQLLCSPSSLLPSFVDNSKPSFVVESKANEIPAESGTSPFPLDEQEQQQKQSTPIATTTNIEGENNGGEEAEEEEEEQFLRPPSICLEQLEQRNNNLEVPQAAEEFGEKGGNENEIGMVKGVRNEEEEKEEQRILQILTGLQKDLDNFSMSSLSDCSDGRALLDGEQRRERRLAVLEEGKSREAMKEFINDNNNDDHVVVAPTVRQSLVVGMDLNEFERRTEMEERKATKELDKLEEQQKRQSQNNGNKSQGGGTISTMFSTACHSPGTIKQMLIPNKKVEDQKEEKGAAESPAKLIDELPKSKKEPVKDWSPEADLAYKLLVQCGHLLKDTKTAANGSSSNIGGKEGGAKCQTMGGVVAGSSSGNKMPLPKMAQKIPLLISNPLNGITKRPGLTTSLMGWREMPDVNEEEKKEHTVPSKNNSTTTIEYINSRLLGNTEMMKGEEEGNGHSRGGNGHLHGGPRVGIDGHERERQKSEGTTTMTTTTMAAMNGGNNNYFYCDKGGGGGEPIDGGGIGVGSSTDDKANIALAASGVAKSRSPPPVPPKPRLKVSFRSPNRQPLNADALAPKQ